jgi:hypothetical protein
MKTKIQARKCVKGSALYHAKPQHRIHIYSPYVYVCVYDVGLSSDEIR